MCHTHCNDCGMVYGSDSWIEGIVTDDIWNKIKPTKNDDDCGILCISCINRRLKILGYDNVPIWFHGTEALTAKEGMRTGMNTDTGTFDNTDAFSESLPEAINDMDKRLKRGKRGNLCDGIGDCEDSMAEQCADADWCNITGTEEAHYTTGLKPSKCTPVGEYKCQIPMPLNGRVEGVDICIADIVAALNAANIPTDASCCGHGKMMGSVLLTDGRVLRIRFNRPLSREIE